ncbi:MAG: hypothetical protein ACI4EK_05325 [Wujia sp.]
MSQEEKNVEKISYEESVRKLPVARVMAWIGIIIIIGLIIATMITGITGSKYFLPCLALMIVMPILIYIIVWFGKIIYKHGK